MKSKLIKYNDSNNRQTRISGNNELNCLSQLNDLKELRNQNINDTARVNPNIFKRDNDNNFESLFLKNLVENLFEYLSEQNNKEERLFSKMDEVPMLGEMESNFNFNNNNKDIYNKYNNNFDSIINAQRNNINNINSNKEENLNFESYLRANANSINNKYGEKLKKIGQANIEMEKIQLQLKENLDRNLNQNLNQNINKEFNQEFNTNLNLNLTKKNTNINLIDQINIDNNRNNKINDLKMSQEFNSISNGNLNGNINGNSNQNRLNFSEEEKSLFMKSIFSPNPFEELQTNNPPSFLNSPKINPYGNNLLKSIEENNEKLNINFDISRNSSIDYSEIFKYSSENKEIKKQPKDDNLLYDDSFFEISSN
jgi:hypothetical protein